MKPISSLQISFSFFFKARNRSPQERFAFGCFHPKDILLCSQEQPLLHFIAKLPSSSPNLVLLMAKKKKRDGLQKNHGPRHPHCSIADLTLRRGENWEILEEGKPNHTIV